MKSKDPFLALMFSFMFPGLGQIYSGRLKRGVLFLTVHLGFIGALASFMFHPTMKTNRYFLLPVSFFLVFEIFVILDAYLFTKRSNPACRRSLGGKVLIPLATVFFMFVFNFNILIASVIKRYIAPVARVRSNSMLPRLVVGDWFLINKMIYRQASPRRGDIVFFDFHKDENRVVVKRIIAHGGETVGIKDGDITINGQLMGIPGPADIYYHNGGEFGKAGRTVKVPLGHYYVLGDNSETSIDSRYWGFVPGENIIGKAHKIIYPFERSGPVY